MDALTDEERDLIREALDSGRITRLEDGIANDYEALPPREYLRLYYENVARGKRLREASRDKAAPVSRSAWIEQHTGRLVTSLRIKDGF